MSSISEKYKEASAKIDAFVATKQTQYDELKIKKQNTGNNFAQTKSESLKQLNSMGDIKQRAQQQVRTSFDELVDLFKKSVPNTQNSGSNTIDFLIRQLLLASNETKNKIGEIIASEVLNVAGCSEEQTFDPSQKIYIKVSEIDLKQLLKNNPTQKPWNIVYERDNINVGQVPFSMNKELYNRIQNEGVSFNQEYGTNYIGASGYGIFDIKYVKSYIQGGTTFYGDFFEVTLQNRIKGNNVSDFLRDYYKSLSLLDFDSIMTEIMNILTNVIDISGNVSVEKNEDQSRFSIILQRILGLCFDNTKEIDVQGTSKIGQLDNIDQSFFELSPTDLKNIEIQTNNIILGVTEFTDCDNVKLPINSDSLINSIQYIRDLGDDPSQKVDALISTINNMSNDQDWSLNIPDGVNLNLNVAINNDLLKSIPKGVMMSILSPKMLLGLFIVIKSLNDTYSANIEDFKSFIDNFGQFLIRIMSKIAAVFIEELFKLLKKNIRLLVETLLLEIVKESKDKRLTMISSIIFIITQIVSGIIDYRECNSLVDEILKLLNLGSVALGVSIPTFSLAFSSVLGGYSPTRAMTEVTQNLQEIGIPTGDLPSGAPNVGLSAIFQQIKGTYNEQLKNGKVEIWVPPLAVPPVVGGSTIPIKASGKYF